MLCYFDVAPTWCCTNSMLRWLNVVPFRCYTISMLRYFLRNPHPWVKNCYFNVALFWWCTISMLRYFNVALFDVALFRCCAISMLHYFDVALLWCCAILLLRYFNVALFRWIFSTQPTLLFQFNNFNWTWKKHSALCWTSKKRKIALFRRWAISMLRYFTDTHYFKDTEVLEAHNRASLTRPKQIVNSKILLWWLPKKKSGKSGKRVGWARKNLYVTK